MHFGGTLGAERSAWTPARSCGVQSGTERLTLPCRGAATRRPGVRSSRRRSRRRCLSTRPLARSLGVSRRLPMRREGTRRPVRCAGWAPSGVRTSSCLRILRGATCCPTRCPGGSSACAEPRRGPRWPGTILSDVRSVRRVGPRGAVFSAPTSPSSCVRTTDRLRTLRGLIRRSVTCVAGSSACAERRPGRTRPEPSSRTRARPTRRTASSEVRHPRDRSTGAPRWGCRPEMGPRGPGLRQRVRGRCATQLNRTLLGGAMVRSRCRPTLR